MRRPGPGHLVGLALFAATAAVGVGSVVWVAPTLELAPELAEAPVEAEPPHLCPPQAARVLAALERRTRAWDGELRHQVADAVAEESARAGFDPLLVLAVIDAESDFRLDPVSPAGARGIMQLRPDTLRAMAKREGVALDEENADEPTTQVRLGTRYLRALIESFAGRVDLGLMAYNAGPNRLVSKIREGSTETLAPYVGEVRRSYLLLRRGLGEAGAWGDVLRRGERSEVAND